MNYEFFFLRQAGQRRPKVLRVIAPSQNQAIAAVARQYGWTAPTDNCKRMNRYLHSNNVHSINVQNIFPRRMETAERIRLPN